MLRLLAALQGNLKEEMAAEVKTAQQAVSQGIQQATDGLKGELRGQIVTAGLGQRLAGSWQGKVYPRGGHSLNAAGYVYNKAPDIVRAFNDGVTIRSTHGRFLAIPTQYVIRQKNRRISPRDFEEAGIPLRFIPPQGARKVGLLVADNFRVTSKGRARVASPTALRTGRGLASIIMFVLVPQVSIRKRLDIDSVAQKWIDKLPQLVVEAWPDKEASS
jgi:hypothetical protein